MRACIDRRVCVIYQRHLVCSELRYLRKQHRKVQKRLTKDSDTHKEAGEITRQEHLFGLKVIYHFKGVFLSMYTEY